MRDRSIVTYVVTNFNTCSALWVWHIHPERFLRTWRWSRLWDSDCNSTTLHLPQTCASVQYFWRSLVIFLERQVLCSENENGHSGWTWTWTSHYLPEVTWVLSSFLPASTTNSSPTLEAGLFTYGKTSLYIKNLTQFFNALVGRTSEWSRVTTKWDLGTHFSPIYSRTSATPILALQTSETL